MSGLCNQWHSSLKDYEILAKIFADNDLEAEYSDENSKESGNSIVSGRQLETENTEIENASLVADGKHVLILNQ